MKTISGSLSTHLDGEVTTLCTCWRIVRTDGEIFTFTDHDKDLVISGETYIAGSGYNRTALTNDADWSVSNMEVLGFLDSAVITEEELRAGVFNRARIFIFLTNWANLSQGVLKAATGWFGEVTLTQNGMFQTELRSLTQALSHNFIEFYSPECRADFCDERCKLIITDYEQATTIATVTDRTEFTITAATFPAQGFVNGKIRFTSGANAGRAMEIIGYDNATKKVTLFEALPYLPVIGDGVVIASGCDKRRVTCKSYNNVINMRGEPDVPGNDEFMQYPDAN